MHTHTCTHTHMYTHTHTCTHTYTQVHTHPHTCTHIHTHTIGRKCEGWIDAPSGGGEDELMVRHAVDGEVDDGVLRFSDVLLGKDDPYPYCLHLVGLL